MLTIIVPETEYFDEKTQTFESIKETKLQLEHSLVSISKWESKWHKSFLSDDKKTQEEFRDYVKCMTITQNVNPVVYSVLTPKNLKEIADYMDNPMTATTISSFGDDKRNRRKDRVTSELIYYWMIAFNINFECQKWHLNRLLMLIQICKIKNDQSGGKKMTRSQIINRNKMINEANKAKFNTRG